MRKKGLARVLAVCLCALLCTGTLTSCQGDAGAGTQSTAGTEEGQPVKKEIFAMDTIMDLTVYGPLAGEAADQGIELIQKLNGLFSVTNENSDIAKLNRAQGKAVKVSKETYELVSLCQTISEETEGCLDLSIYPVVKAWGFTTDNMHVPSEMERKEAMSHVDYTKIRLLKDQKIRIEKGMELDLGAAAKGYLSQKLMDLWREMGVTSAIVSLGGNVQTLGKKEDGSDFTVGITDPSDGSSIFGTLKVSDKAVITSGIYQRYFEENGVRYHHIMDRRTGKPAENNLASVTVVSDTGWRADALATALYVMGPEKAKEYQKTHPETGIILIYKDGTFWQSEGVGMECS